MIIIRRMNYKMSERKEKDFENPTETSSSKNTSSFKPPSIPSTSGKASTWSRFKDPRVVRVSRALGGKDRHSKVCTVRGLRDRRVRLSVPTAIQLYDLQERLGLNQPSKVVDWLLNAAKREIDELPPLQIPQGMFTFGNDHHHSNGNYTLDQPMLNFQDFGSGSQLPDKQGLKMSSAHGDHRDEDWGRNQEERRFHHHLEDTTTSTNNTCISSSSYNSIFKLDPSNSTLSHTSRVGHVSAQHEDWPSYGLLPFQPTVLPGPHQVLVYHQPAAGITSTQSYLPMNGELDPKHEVSFQRSHLSNSSFSSTRQIQFNTTANLLPSQDHNDETRNMK